ncbi:TerC/Alx family metal homeostasis membrane protein [Amycolatopsis keratiniphila]|uniref:Tellurium resistance protein TerC n=1 Tax=Amycolatopsis keratiniphila subsp. keratiniphila TaxID=227715 RepID=A0A1W2LKU5_9PSEU|nr:TerC/Alx family metal homeostasis membrane protein [Amycolatopsis keratiniphila]OLZ52815.1 tellurium resistance protein TerC [Amycolatopsis keratiniphila subsp. nogabecina]ONF63426.1 tellurium resistance protein TerC [Amycolatopsis keratiniphila subsp. keratiniphila]SDU08288.1 integral membrane protein, TerC family [Amycolatopsis keratiniphila]
MPESVATVGSPGLWAISIAVLLALLVADFAVTRRPHEVSMREAAGWSAFYLALPVVFGLWLWLEFGGGQALEFMTGFVVEKSLSVDNLFVFMLLLAAFAVPSEVQQRVLLYGIVGALLLRGVFIAAGAAMLSAGTWAFLVFGVILFVSAIKILREAMSGGQSEMDLSQLRSVRLLRRLMPVTDDYRGTRLTVREHGRRALTPLAVVVVAVFATDVVFAVDSVPAVYGITEDPYLVFATNAFALMGLRALYFVLHSALAKLVHLNHGLAIILAFIGVKLVLHWAHGIWPSVPQVPTPASLGVIVAVLVTVSFTSLYARRREAARAARE